MIHKVDTKVDLEQELRNIVQDKPESIVAFHARRMEVMRHLAIKDSHLA
jgi:hypothetical protein